MGNMSNVLSRSGDYCPKMFTLKYNLDRLLWSQGFNLELTLPRDDRETLMRFRLVNACLLKCLPLVGPADKRNTVLF